MSTETAETIIFPSLPYQLQKTETEGQTKIVIPKEDSEPSFALGTIYEIYSRKKSAPQSLTPLPTKSKPQLSIESAAQQIRRKQFDSLSNEAALRRLGYEAFGSPYDSPEPGIRIYPLLGNLDEYNTIPQYWKTNKFSKDGTPDITTGFRFIKEFQEDLIASLEEFLTDLTPTAIAHLNLEAETTAVADLGTKLKDYDGDNEILHAFKELLKLKDLLQELSSELASFHDYNQKDPKTGKRRERPIINTDIEIPYFPQMALKYIKAFQETAPDQSDPNLTEKLTGLAQQLQLKQLQNWKYLRDLIILLSKFFRIKEIIDQTIQITRPLQQALNHPRTDFIAALDKEIPSFFENPEEFTGFARFATQVYYLYYRSSIKPEEVPKLLPIMYATLLQRYHPLQNVEIYIQEGNDPSQVPLLILKWKDQQTKEEKTRVLSTTF